VATFNFEQSIYATHFGNGIKAYDVAGMLSNEVGLQG